MLSDRWWGRSLMALELVSKFGGRICLYDPRATSSAEARVRPLVHLNLLK